MAIYTEEQLREYFGLQVYEDTQELTGIKPERRIVKVAYADLFGVKPKQVLAKPPFNPDCRQTQLKRVIHNGYLHWRLRAEGPHWQGDLFLEAEHEEHGEPIYECLDELQEVFPQMLEAVKQAPPMAPAARYPANDFQYHGHLPRTL